MNNLEYSKIITEFVMHLLTKIIYLENYTTADAYDNDTCANGDWFYNQITNGLDIIFANQNVKNIFQNLCNIFRLRFFQKLFF